MLVRACAVVGVFLLLLSPIRADEATKTEAPIFSAQIRSVHELLADMQYLLSLAGQAEQGKQIMEFVHSIGGENGLQGINENEPVGVYKTDVTTPNAVVMVPVSNEKAILDLLGNLGQKPSKDANGVYSISADFPPGTIYFRFANKYAYVSRDDKDAIAGDLLKPTDVFRSKSKALLSAVLRIDRIPGHLKQLGLSQLDEKLDEAKQEKKPGETETQRKLKVQIIDDFGTRAHRVVDEGREVELSLDIDRQAGRLRVAASFSGKADSELAANINQLASEESLFAGIPQTTAAVQMIFRGSTPANVRKQFEQAVREGMAKGLQHETNEQKREVAKRVLQSLAPTVTAGQMDVFFQMRGPSADKLYTAVAAARLKDGLQVQQALRQALKSAPAQDQANIHLDAEKIGDVNVSRLDIQKTADRNYKQTFGTNPAYVAFRDDAAFIAMGPDAMDALKEALAGQPKATDIFDLRMTVGRLIPFIVQHNPQAAPAAEKLAKQHLTNDLIQVRLRGGPSLRLDMTVHSGALKLLGQMAAEKRAAAEASDKDQ